jgi:hypothetical protein
VVILLAAFVAMQGVQLRRTTRDRANRERDRAIRITDFIMGTFKCRTAAKHEATVYVNLGSSPSCSTIATCWGNPHGFLHDLGKSDFIYVADQYVGRTEDDRYRVSDPGSS